MLFILPVASMIAFIFNDLGVSLGFWDLKPIHAENESISALPLNIGIYPVVSCFMIYIITKIRSRHYLVILSFSLCLTLAEYITFLVGYALYSHKWNIFFTFLSYAAAFLLVYAYYNHIKNYISANTDVT